jgi:hypothetical protein
MKIAVGLKAHSGWAALVSVAAPDGVPQVVERRRIELIDPEDAYWAKQPYHAAEGLDPGEARDVVKRGVRSARRLAVREVRALLARAKEAKHEIAALAVLTAEPMPDWSVDEILAVHFRMHKAEGVLFRDALARATEACGVRLVAILEKELPSVAERALATPRAGLAKRIAALGDGIGAPWAKDQKDAALAALVALRGR